MDIPDSVKLEIEAFAVVEELELESSLDINLGLFGDFLERSC